MCGYNDRRTGKNRRETSKRIYENKIFEINPRRGERRFPGDRRDRKNPLTYIQF